MRQKQSATLTKRYRNREPPATNQKKKLFKLDSSKDNATLCTVSIVSDKPKTDSNKKLR